MTNSRKRGFWSHFKPDYFVNSIHEINADWLGERGLKGLVVDVDNTMMVRDSAVPGPRLRAWLADLRAAGVSIIVVSNNWSSRVKKIAGELELGLIAPAGKPLASGYLKALGELKLSADQTAFLGDQVFTDVLGANRAGMTSILVPPLGEIDLIHTKILRVFEKVLLRRLAKQSLQNGRWQAI